MVWPALPPHAGDKPWMGCGGDGAVGSGYGREFCCGVQWGVVGSSGWGWG